MEDYDRSGTYSYGGNSHNFNASSSNNNMQLQTYYGGPHELRCYSASYAQAQTNGNFHGDNKRRDFKLKKGKSTSASASNSWSIADPELQRKRRVASYKMYGVEGKVKGSFRKSFRWLKDRYSQVVHGWR
ncbi:uncharacterized protein LOC115741122 [Rhodamnia argentea]|uniref:Uncharacterized protein LOC115741122 n=1 Tax=Rhodamnia argentea TaxID=178133 RepID=A0A8B8P7J5_9MYRT|nr:uncharacterized protein LOC115741122 [Rhodamnia argentea]